MNKKYHVYYQTPKTFGEVDITQDIYAPITPEVLDDARRIIRELNGLPEDTPVVIVNWQRFEGEGE